MLATLIEHTRTSRRADATMVDIAARWAMLVLLPSTLSLGAFIANRVIGELDGLSVRVDQFNTEQARAITDLDVRISRIETRLEYARRAQ